MPTGLEPPVADAGPGVWLHQSEIDLLCTFADVRAPFPLRITPVGLTADERRSVFRRSRAQLTSLGLADHRSPRGLAADFVHLLRDGAGALDIHVAQRDQVHGAVVLARRDEALLVSQDVREEGGPVHLMGLATHEAVDHLLEMVPVHEAAMTSPFSLPKRPLENLYREVMAAVEPDGSPRRFSSDEVERLLAEHGIDEHTARRVSANLQPVLGNGQAGVAVRGGRGGGWTRAGEEVRWMDSVRGRFRLVGEPGGDWMSVNPLSREELRGQLRGLVNELWF